MIYGLPKIHKKDIPHWPVISVIKSPNYDLANFLFATFQPFVGKTSTFIKDSANFIHLIQTLHLDPTDTLVSFDGISLFTKIPIKEVLEIIGNLVNPHIANLIRIFLKSTFFTYQGQFYEKTEGTTMGSSLSHVITNLFMEHFEIQVLETSYLKPHCWRRFVDDTFVIWLHPKISLTQFLNHINSESLHIQFTMEIEKNNSLPFLDVLVTRNNNGSLSHQVYRKKTHVDRYFNAKSHHHPSQKLGVFNTLVVRAHCISKQNHLVQEQNHLRHSL